MTVRAALRRLVAERLSTPQVARLTEFTQAEVRNTADRRTQVISNLAQHCLEWHWAWRARGNAAMNPLARSISFVDRGDRSRP